MDRYNRQPEKLTTVREAAVLLGLKECTVRLWMYRGILGRVKLGTKAVRIPVADIARLIDEGRTPANVASR
jgi:excisionase family DNA binding protein